MAKLYIMRSHSGITDSTKDLKETFMRQNGSRQFIGRELVDAPKESKQKR